MIPISLLVYLALPPWGREGHLVPWLGLGLGTGLTGHPSHIVRINQNNGGEKFGHQPAKTHNTLCPLKLRSARPLDPLPVNRYYPATFPHKTVALINMLQMFQVRHLFPGAGQISMVGARSARPHKQHLVQQLPGNTINIEMHHSIACVIPTKKC